jgi:D-sedoheptulose 7-phosphate isomerase
MSIFINFKDEAIMGNSVLDSILTNLIKRHPSLSVFQADIEKAFAVLCNCYQSDGKLLVCGNGGSAADAEHIVGELMKSFSRVRVLPDRIKEQLKTACPERGPSLAMKLQPALPAISLVGNYSLSSAFANDVDAQMIFAQQVIGYGRVGDVLLAISTSGNAENVLNAAVAARAMGLKIIGLTGGSGGRLRAYCDVVIGVPGNETSDIQEFHLPVYHALCKMLEINFFQ